MLLGASCAYARAKAGRSFHVDKKARKAAECRIDAAEDHVANRRLLGTMDPIRRLQKEWRDKAHLLPRHQRARFLAMWRDAQRHAESLYYAWRPVTLRDVSELLLRDPAIELREFFESMAGSSTNADRRAAH